MKTRVKTAEEIKAIRKSGEILAQVLDYLQKSIRAGMTTQDIDDLALAHTIKLRARPAFHGYQDYPANLCVSVNDEVVHTIPGPRIIKNGDIVGLDYGVIYDGMITDSAITVAVGEVSRSADRLLLGTKRALDKALDVLRDGVRVGDVGAAIEAELSAHGLSPAEGLSGHGVGHQVHEDPSIPNFGVKGRGQILKAGMTVAIEPIAALGNGHIYLADDGWTYKTIDGSLAAQFEHTALITSRGAEILTAIN